MSLIILSRSRRMIRQVIETPSGAFVSWAELPRTRFQPPFVLPSGTVRTVSSGGDVQAALTASVPGDIVVLESGATFVGNFTLPTKTGSGDIYVMASAAYGGTFDTAIGTRKTTDAGLVTLRHTGTGNTPLLAAATGSGRTGWRFVGVRLDLPPGYTGSLNSLIKFGDHTEATVANYPGRFAFDRCRIVGRPLANLRRGIWITGPDFYFGDGQVIDVNSITPEGDSQCLLFTSAAANGLVTNSELSGATEVTMFGGLDANAIADLTVVPTDITVEKSWLHHNDYQDPTNGAFNGQTYNTKNLGEMKAGKRIAWRNCVVSRHLGKDQQYAFQIKSNLGGSQATQNTADVVMQNVKFIDVMALLGCKGFDDDPASAGLRRIVMSNAALYGAKDTTTITPRVLSCEQYGRNIHLDRVTAILTDPDSGISYIEPGGSNQMFDIRVTNSILGGTYGMQIAGDVDAGMSALIGGERTILNNLLVGRPNRYDPSNARPVNSAAVGFTSYANAGGDNLELAGGSAYKGTGIGGADPGCDTAVLTSATAGCVSGIW